MNQCPFCRKPAIYRFKVHGTTICTCHDHARLEDFELLIEVADQTLKGRAEITEPLKPGAVIKLPNAGLGLGLVTHVTPSGGAIVKLRNGTNLGLNKNAVADCKLLTP